MYTHGIRISDSKNNVLDVNIYDILEEIKNGNELNWCILFLDGLPLYGRGCIVNEYKNKINESKGGFIVKWEDIFLIVCEMSQIFEMTILGCSNEMFLHRYDNDQTMYQSCDIVIELIDCAFWQVFSKNHELIDVLKRKFKEIELLKPNFEK